MKILEEKVQLMVHDTNKDKKGVLYVVSFLPLTVHDAHAVAQYYEQNQEIKDLNLKNGPIWVQKPEGNMDPGMMNP